LFHVKHTQDESAGTAGSENRWPGATGPLAAHFAHPAPLRVVGRQAAAPAISTGRGGAAPKYAIDIGSSKSSPLIADLLVCWAHVPRSLRSRETRGLSGSVSTKGIAGALPQVVVPHETIKQPQFLPLAR
jgi:hypothetical protein